MALDKERQKQVRHEAYVRNREAWLRASKDYYYKSRAALFDVLGWTCARCGFADARALQIDHIHGGGGRHMKRITSRSAYYSDLLNDPEVKSKYQVLCANCNWIKHIGDNEARRRCDAISN